MGIAASVTLFPQDPSHRLVGADLGAFLDRLSERAVALGEGARARVRAGRFDAEVRTVQDLLDTVDAARVSARGREDLEIRLWGPPRDALAKYLGALHLEIKFCAFVQPHVLLDCRRCAGCGWPLDFDGTTGRSACARRACGEGEAQGDELSTCWWLRWFGEGSYGIGERFSEEGRRLEGAPVFESLQGIARTALYEWHAWT